MFYAFIPCLFFFLASPRSLQDLSSPTRAQALKAPSPPNHWTARNSYTCVLAKKKKNEHELKVQFYSRHSTWGRRRTRIGT